MLIHDIHFYNIPNHQYENSQYSLKPEITERLCTIEGVKLTRLDDMFINIPLDDCRDDILNANIVEIDGLFYDLLEIEIRTLDSESAKILVSFNPVLNLDEDVYLTGWYDRGPSYNYWGGVYNVDRLPIEFDAHLTESQFVPATDWVLSAGSNDPRTPVYYAQLISTKSLNGKGDKAIDGYLSMYSTVFGGSNVLPSRARALGVYKSGSGSSDFWAHIVDFVYNPDSAMKIPADTIQAIHISRRSPWKLQYDSEESRYDFLKINGDAITPTNMGPATTIEMGREAVITNDINVYVHLSEVERYLASISIVDEMGNKIGMVPNSYWGPTGGTVHFTFCPRADFTGITTTVIASVNGVDKPIAKFPEGQLPWSGDAWTNYVIRARDSDRIALKHSMDMAVDGFWTDIGEGGANALLTAGVGGSPVSAIAGLAQFGVSAVTSAKRLEMQTKDLLFQQELAEGRIKNSPSPYYDAAYGFGYCTTLWNRGAGILVEIPEGADEVYDDYIRMRGIPIKRVAKYKVGPGYYRGELHKVEGVNFNAMQLKKFRTWMLQGFRVV